MVKGDPGIGKSSLAYSIAHHLDLGSVLRWEINSRSRLQDGLYEYRAVEHLGASQTSKKKDVAIESYIELGPLGTALVGGAKDSNKDKHRPRVLLIDEIDKSDYDLSNDLLHVLEESEFAISELRSKSSDDVSTVYAEDAGKIKIKGNKVVSHCHPIVIMTSNNEREFPAPFLRRCVEVELPNPDPQQLQKIIANHFKGSLLSEEVSSLPNSDDMSQNPAEALQEAYLAAVDGIDGIELKDLQSRNAANQNDNNSDEN